MHATTMKPLKRAALLSALLWLLPAPALATAPQATTLKPATCTTVSTVTPMMPNGSCRISHV